MSSLCYPCRNFFVDPKSDEDKAKLFSVPDFVGDLCKAIASRVRGAVAGVKFDDFHKASALLFALFAHMNCSLFCPSFLLTSIHIFCSSLLLNFFAHLICSSFLLYSLAHHFFFTRWLIIFAHLIYPFCCFTRLLNFFAHLVCSSFLLYSFPRLFCITRLLIFFIVNRKGMVRKATAEQRILQIMLN